MSVDLGKVSILGYEFTTADMLAGYYAAMTSLGHVEVVWAEGRVVPIAGSWRVYWRPSNLEIADPILIVEQRTMKPDRDNRLGQACAEATRVLNGICHAINFEHLEEPG